MINSIKFFQAKSLGIGYRRGLNYHYGHRVATHDCLNLH